MKPRLPERLPSSPAAAAMGKTVFDASKQVGLEQIDLTRYDLDTFRSDIAEIVNIRGAIFDAGKVVVAVPIVAAIVAWLLLAIPLDGAGLFFAVFFLFLLAIPVAAVGALAWITRRRFARTTRAAGRAVELVGLIHTDVDAVRETGAEVPMRAVGAVVAEEAVFPALRGGIEQWSSLTGPIGFAARPLISSTLKAIEKKAVALIRELPDKPTAELEATTPVDSDEVALTAGTEAPLTATSDNSATENAVTREYTTLKDRAETIVGRVGGVVTVPLLVAAIGATLLWFLLVAILAALG